jgi:anti-sigma regulatory factor (Ser/Thr protein kinase)
MVEVDDEVRLVIPAEPGFLRLARLTAAAVASRMGFTFDEVEDLRIAVDELCYFLLGSGRGAGAITLLCTISADGLVVTGTGSGPDGSGSETTLPELSRRILESVVDEYECDGTTAEPRFRLLKRRSDP